MLYPAELQALPQPRTVTLAQREICCLPRSGYEPFWRNHGLAPRSLHVLFQDASVL